MGAWDGDVRGDGLVGGAEALHVSAGAGGDLVSLGLEASADDVLGLAVLVLGSNASGDEQSESSEELHGDGCGVCLCCG